MSNAPIDLTMDSDSENENKPPAPLTTHKKVSKRKSNVPSGDQRKRARGLQGEALQRGDQLRHEAARAVDEDVEMDELEAAATEPSVADQIDQAVKARLAATAGVKKPKTPITVDPGYQYKWCGGLGNLQKIRATQTPSLTSDDLMTNGPTMYRKIDNGIWVKDTSEAAYKEVALRDTAKQIKTSVPQASTLMLDMYSATIELRLAHPHLDQAAILELAKKRLDGKYPGIFGPSTNEQMHKMMLGGLAASDRDERVTGLLRRREKVVAEDSWLQPEQDWL